MKSFLYLLAFLVFFSISINSCKKEYSCEHCITTKQSPVANAGKDTIIILPANAVLLNGSGSRDIDGTIVSYKWSKISGPASSNIIKPSQSLSDVTSLELGVYQFQLMVTDNDGLVSKDTITVTVTSSSNNSSNNQLPVAVAGKDEIRTLSSQNIILDGSNSYDPDGTITAYQWTKISGPAVTINTPTMAVSSLKNYVEGDYVFKLTVTDKSGATSSDTVKLTIINDDISGYEYSFSTVWGFNDIIADYDVYTGTDGPNADLFVDDNVLLYVFVKLDTSSVWVAVPRVPSYAALADGLSYFIYEHRLFIYVYFPGSVRLIGREVSVRIKFL